MPERPIYLDYNATTPIAPEVADAMRAWLNERFGNASSHHAYGRAAREALEAARADVAALLDARPGEIVFTSGGTESNNTVIRGAAERWGREGGHVVTSAVEHPAVLEPCRWLARRGFDLTVVPVDGEGRVDPEHVARALRRDTRLVTIMHANNEVGTVQPLREIAAVGRAHGVPVHTDAAQSVGKIPVHVDELGVDWLSLAGHKLHAPAGVGALYVRDGAPFERLMLGAGHEGGRRAGTENLLEIVGLGAAARLALRHLAQGSAHLVRLRERLFARLQAAEPGILRNGRHEDGLPNTLSVSFPGLDATTLLTALGDRVAASAGAACHAAGVTVSTVLAAMGVPPEQARGTVRFSLGWPTTEEQVDAAATHVATWLRERGRTGS